MICKLIKGIYGLKQTAKTWNKTLDNILQKAGFKQSKIDPCLYTTIPKGKYIYLTVYIF